MTNLFVSTDAQRARYERLVAIMNELGEGQFIVSQHTLVLENVVNATANNYRFSFYEELGQRASEVRLNRNDAFFCSHIGLWLYKTTAQDQSGAAPKWTWPNAAVFAGAGEATALELVYNGLLSFDTKPVQRFQKFQTSVLRVNPGAVATALGAPQWGPPSNTLFPITPEIIFDGQMDNTAVLELGVGTPTAGAATPPVQNVICVALHGYLVVNGGSRLGRWYTN